MRARRIDTRSTCLSHFFPLLLALDPFLDGSVKGAQVWTDCRHKGGPFHWSCLFSHHLHTWGCKKPMGSESLGSWKMRCRPRASSQLRGSCQVTPWNFRNFRNFRDFRPLASGLLGLREALGISSELLNAPWVAACNWPNGLKAKDSMLSAGLSRLVPPKRVQRCHAVSGWNPGLKPQRRHLPNLGWATFGLLAPCLRTS